MSKEMIIFIQILVQGLVTGSVYALVALGFVLIYKSTSVINFAQGELLLFGAYICLALTATANIPFWAAFFLTMLVSVFMGMLVERTILRPMIGEPVISIIMLTIGLAIVLRSIVVIIWGSMIKVYPRAFSEAPMHIGPVVISQVYVWTLFFSVLFMVAFAIFFKYTRIGIAMRATADDQQVAQSMGISVGRVFSISWSIAAMVSAVGGMLIGHINGVNLELADFGLKVFPAVILGGLDSVPGAILGGIIVGILEKLAGGYLPIGGEVELVAPFVILVVILMIKPYGLFGTEEIERV